MHQTGESIGDENIVLLVTEIHPRKYGRLEGLKTGSFDRDYRRPPFFFLERPRMMSSARFSSSNTVVKV